MYLTICSNTALKYTEAELLLIREFVENGGGLLLSRQHKPVFERDVREPISALGINHVRFSLRCAVSSVT